MPAEETPWLSGVARDKPSSSVGEAARAAVQPDAIGSATPPIMRESAPRRDISPKLSAIFASKFPVAVHFTRLPPLCSHVTVILCPSACLP